MSQQKMHIVNLGFLVLYLETLLRVPLGHWKKLQKILKPKQKNMGIDVTANKEQNSHKDRKQSINCLEPKITPSSDLLWFSYSHNPLHQGVISDHFTPSIFLFHALPEATNQGVGGVGRREIKSVPFINYLLALQKSQLLSDDLVNGVEIRCEEKGSCPSGCHLCHHQGMMGGGSGRTRNDNGRSGEQPSPIPVLLEVSRVVPLYSLIQDNITKEVRETQMNYSLYY